MNFDNVLEKYRAESMNMRSQADKFERSKGAFRLCMLLLLNKQTKASIQYNSSLTVSNIPAKVYDYVINGKSAVEWIMERYQVKTDPASQITNDRNLNKNLYGDMPTCWNL